MWTAVKKSASCLKSGPGLTRNFSTEARARPEHKVGPKFRNRRETQNKSKVALPDPTRPWLWAAHWLWVFGKGLHTATWKRTCVYDEWKHAFPLRRVLVCSELF